MPARAFGRSFRLGWRTPPLSEAQFAPYRPHLKEVAFDQIDLDPGAHQDPKGAGRPIRGQDPQEQS